MTFKGLGEIECGDRFALVWPGWRCTRGYAHDGPCALVPRWWNLRARWASRARR